MRNVGIGIIVAFFAFGLIWSLSFSSLPEADFTFSNGTEVKSIDPALVTGQPEGRIVRGLFEGLLNWDPETCAPLPGMADRWEVSDDGLVYTFHIRDDARWSDGSPLTAPQYEWSLRRFLHPGTAAEYAYILWDIAGAEKYTKAELQPGDAVEIELHEKIEGSLPHAAGRTIRGKLLAIDYPNNAGHEDANDGDDAGHGSETGNGPPIYTVEIDGRERRFQVGAKHQGTKDYVWLVLDFEQVGIRAIDKRTLQITLRNRVDYFLKVIGFYPTFPVNRRCVETYGYPNWTRPDNIVSNGPFTLTFRRIRDRIRMTRNPQYWDVANVQLETIDALACESSTTNLNLYLTGQADWITSVPLEVVPDLLARPEGDYNPAVEFSSYYYLVNTDRPPLDDPRVRRALSLALNREEIVERVTRAGEKPALSIVPPDIKSVMDYTPQQTDAENIREAQQLLAEAGYPGGEGFPRIEILYNTLESHKSIAELIMKQWKHHLGIDVGLTNQEWGKYLSSRREGKFDIARAGWSGDYIDPVTFLEMYETTNPSNHTRWSNAAFDQAMADARDAADPESRLKELERAERVLMDEMPTIPIYYTVGQNMVRPYVKGYYANLLDTHPLKYLSIDQEQKREVLGR